MLESVREVEIWLRPGVQLLDVTGPVEVFASTTRYCRHFGIEGGYRLRLLADRRGTVTTAAGIPLIAEATGAVLDRQPAKTATLLIPSLLEEPDLPPDPRLEPSGGPLARPAGFGLRRRLGAGPSRPPRSTTGNHALAHRRAHAAALPQS